MNEGNRICTKSASIVALRKSSKFIGYGFIPDYFVFSSQKRVYGFLLAIFVKNVVDMKLKRVFCCGERILYCDMLKCIVVEMWLL